MSCVLVVVVIYAIIFVLVGLSSFPALLLGFGLDLQSGDLLASKEQPQHFILPLVSGVVRYLSLKVHFSTCSKILVGAGTLGCLRWNFRQPGVPTQTTGSSDSYVDFTTSAKMNFKYEISYNPTSKWLGRHK